MASGKLGWGTRRGPQSPVWPDALSHDALNNARLVCVCSPLRLRLRLREESKVEDEIRGGVVELTSKIPDGDVSPRGSPQRRAGGGRHT